MIRRLPLAAQPGCSTLPSRVARRADVKDRLTALLQPISEVKVWWLNGGPQTCPCPEPRTWSYVTFCDTRDVILRNQLKIWSRGGYPALAGGRSPTTRVCQRQEDRDLQERRSWEVG